MVKDEYVLIIYVGALMIRTCCGNLYRHLLFMGELGYSIITEIAKISKNSLKVLVVGSYTHFKVFGIFGNLIEEFLYEKMPTT